MDNNNIPKRFDISMDGQHIEVVVTSDHQQVIFMVQFPDERDRVAITFEVDLDGTENWLENGGLFDRAEEIGRILESKFS
ncbi:hypothetical protein [Chitinophaga rhizophila]|uniref:Uncharacterized protein n=1 Tax=Chitinophaga rhizophila TaxID=2866212 RepID=A0ABS7G7T6_9BACT|nr:hypothetical protein [Chitinophaga rhizophila]MBW8683511.1 hypothetical protein [Chitinophaga rhizophila]